MPRNNEEQQIQEAVVQHLNIRGAPGLVFTHVPNGGKRNIIEAVKLKRMGVLAGVADLLLWLPGKSFALEIKADNGRPTQEQMRFLGDMEFLGHQAKIAYGLDEALAILKSWGVIL